MNDDLSMVNRTLRMVADKRQPIRLRMPMAIALLESEPETAIAALQAMAKDKSCSAKHFARIARALARHASRSSKDPHKRVKGTQRVKPAKVDLSGPCTMQIVLDATLYEQWRTLHFNDPVEVFGRRMLAAAFTTRIPPHLLDALRRIPDYTARTEALDELARQYPRKPVSDVPAPPEPEGEI